MNNEGFRMVSKTVCGSTINVSSYIHSQAMFAPCTRGRTAIFTAEGRIVRSAVEYAGESAGSRHLWETASTAGRCLLSDAPLVRTIGYGDMDEVAFMAEGDVWAYIKIDGTAMKLTVGKIRTEGRMPVTIRVNAEDLRKYAEPYGYRGRSSATLTAGCGDQELFSITYIITAEPRIRLCWWNRYGATDHVNFPTAVEESAEGCIRTFNVWKKSEEYKHNVWLSDITISPAVWMFGNKGYTPVNILTKKVVLTEYAPSPIEIKFTVER